MYPFMMIGVPSPKYRLVYPFMIIGVPPKYRLVYPFIMIGVPPLQLQGGVSHHDDWYDPCK